MPNRADPNRMPFGKFRGKPLADVAKDTGYVTWLLDQRWFAEQYRDLEKRFCSDPLLLKIREVELERARG